jgi:hypothetical protein
MKKVKVKMSSENEVKVLLAILAVPTEKIMGEVDSSKMMTTHQKVDERIWQETFLLQSLYRTFESGDMKG